MKWTLLYLDIVNTIQDRKMCPSVHVGFLGDVFNTTQEEVLHLTVVLSWCIERTGDSVVNGAVIPKYKSSYTKILSHLFGDP